MPQAKKHTKENILKALNSATSLTAARAKLGGASDQTIMSRAFHDIDIRKAYDACKERGVASRRAPRKTPVEVKGVAATDVSSLRRETAYTNRLLQDILVAIRALAPTSVFAEAKPVAPSPDEANGHVPQ